MFEVDPLPFEYNALEPFIDEETMIVHHDGHYATYVKNLNDLLEGNPLGDTPVEDILKSLDQVPEGFRQKVINNAGGVYNHQLFWQMMKPNGGGMPKDGLSEKINSVFGDFAVFKEQFSSAAASLFGSGWVWLVSEEDGELKIITTPNQNSPISEGLTPLLALDLWEHAYYLKYKNKRKDYIEAWWNVVNWAEVEKRFAESS